MKHNRKKSFLRFSTKLILSSIAIFIFSGAYIVIYKPFLNYEQIRVSSQPEKITTNYITYACGDNYPRLYEIIKKEVVENDKTEDKPILLALPNGIPSPEDTELAVSGNVFEISGYRYKLRNENLLTGENFDLSSSRVDVVGWRVQTPYKVWSQKIGSNNEPLLETRYSPVEYKTTNTNHSTQRFRLRKYDSCY